MATNNQVNVGLSGSTGTGTFVGSTGPTLSLPIANNFLTSFTTTATAAGTTTLLVSSNGIQEFTGATTQTVVMPVTSTLTLGQQYYIINNSSGVVTVQSSGANTIQAMAAGTSLLLTCILTSGTTAASWQSSYIADGGGTVNAGTANQIAYYATTGEAVSGLTGANSALLVTDATGVPAMTASLADGEVVIGTTSGTPAPATLTPGTGISIASAAGAITISATGGGFAVATISGTSQNAAVNTMYIALNAGQTTLTLPGTFSVGDTVILVGSTANVGGWIIATAAGDTVMLNGTPTSAGGTLTSTAAAGQTLELVCDVADTSWVAVDGIYTTITTA